MEKRSLESLVRFLNEDPYSMARFSYKIQNSKKTYLYCYDINTDKEFKLIESLIIANGFRIFKRHPNGASTSKLLIIETPQWIRGRRPKRILSQRSGSRSKNS